MPPVTTQSRVFYNNSWKSSNQNNKGKSPIDSCSPQSPRKKRPRHNSKNWSKNQQRKVVKRPSESESPRKVYDRDTLLTLRNSPLSNQKLPDLPLIPGVTAPRIKKKEMPESLRQKLIKRGVIIRESSSDEDSVEEYKTKRSDEDSVEKTFQKLSIKEKSFDSDVIWQSCMLHLI